MTDTRTRLLDGALATLRDKGIAGTSARTIAAAAGVNQALVFYHFGTVDELLAAACAHGATARVAAYADRFATVTSLAELLQVGVELHEEERAEGNVVVLAQILAGAQAEPKLAPAAAAALNLWIAEIETVLHRVLADSPLGPVLDVPGLARSVSAAFIGFELYDGVDPDGAARAMSALAQLGALLTLVEDLGPTTRRLLRSRIRKATTGS
ncbi:TetR/AcrR family transcriptional regulator [Longispora sp. NPDC051575]|uniref:TetR/AcrR family transcriptional regulator n=1 Tax=Longispora sp. NPDC051575 TaxID=3154943 RepID=UPI00343D4069